MLALKQNNEVRTFLAITLDFALITRVREPGPLNGNFA